MNENSVTVVYKWIANEGKLEELTGIYRGVTEAMQANEPGARAVHVYASEAENALYVRDEFEDADAVGFHLSQTAAPHFPALSAIATPGLFQFFGDMPEEMRAAISQMGLTAEYADHITGFDR